MPGDQFWELLQEWDAINFVMGAACSGGVEDALGNGLVTGHAYSLITAKTVQADGQSHRMICMRNPWGNEHEWNGPFSYQWSGWSQFPELKQQLGHSDEKDGLFWMSWDDFKDAWHTISVAMKSMDTRRGTNSTKHGSAQNASSQDSRELAIAAQPVHSAAPGAKKCPFKKQPIRADAIHFKFKVRRKGKEVEVDPKELATNDIIHF